MNTYDSHLVNNSRMRVWVSFQLYFKILLKNINEVPFLCADPDTFKRHLMEVKPVSRNLVYVQTRKKK